MICLYERGCPEVKPKLGAQLPSVETSEGFDRAEVVGVEEQVPKLAWQPVPQWPAVEPQKQLGLQQSPGEVS
jgi:hypothetical protein